MIKALLLPLVLAACAAPSKAPAAKTEAAPGPHCVAKIADAEAAEIGRRIWEHEGGGKILAWWDDTGECPSFGINNYLWFPEGKALPFEESFPQLLDFLRRHGAPPPAWVDAAKGAPWKTRAAFFAETLAPERIRLFPPLKWGMSREMFARVDSPRMKELKAYLEGTVHLQARFSAERMQKALPKMLEAAPYKDRAAIERRFYRVACSRGGLFALVDYVNFKGEGVNPKERYQGEGWGLLQLLGHMKDGEPGPAALGDFADAAEWALRRRVSNAPPERRAGDEAWLAGWLKRVQSYR